MTKTPAARTIRNRYERREPTQYTGAGPTPREAPCAIADTRARMVLPLPKHEYLRSEPYRRWVASQDCAHCKRAGPSQAAHSDAGADGKGMGIKADDSALWPGCADGPLRVGCHTFICSTANFSRDESHTLAAFYIWRTQLKATAEGAWPKGWPLPELAMTREQLA